MLSIPDFVCVGFDIRISAPSQQLSLDATVWPQEEYLYKKAVSELGLKENFFQIIQTESSGDINDLIDFVNGSVDTKLIAVGIPSILLKQCKQRWAYVEPISLDRCSWSSLGFDICDSNGFFSISHMEVLQNPNFDLYNQTNLMDAFVLAQAANILVPAHSPFVVFQIWECNVV